MGADGIDGVRTARFRRTMQLVAAASLYYRGRLGEAGLAAGDFRTLDDPEKLPLTGKTDYIADPLPDDCAVEERVVRFACEILTASRRVSSVIIGSAQDSDLQTDLGADWSPGGAP